MTRVVNIDEILSGDVDFVFDGKAYRFPGDLSTELAFEVFESLVELGEHDIRGQSAGLLATDAGGKALTQKSEQAITRLKTALLKGFQQRDPALTELPFGLQALGLVAEEVLRQIGFSGNPQNRSGRRATARSRKSRTSRPSTSSRK